MSDKIDQVFDLLEKVYTELQNTKTELQDTKTELQATKKELKHDINKIGLCLENEIKPDIKTLYEMQVYHSKKLEEHDNRFDRLEDKVDTLAAKTMRQSYDIGVLKRREKRA